MIPIQKTISAESWQNTISKQAYNPTNCDRYYSNSTTSNKSMLFEMQLDALYVASIVKYHRIIALVQNFFVDTWENHKKDTKLDYANLQRLIKETGFLSNKDV